MLRIISWCLVILLISSTAWGKGSSYVGVSGGFSTGGKFSDFDNETCVRSTYYRDADYYLSSIFSSDPGPRCSSVIHNLNFSGLDTKSSGAWGIKFGYSLDSFPLLGLEFYYFERYPDVHRQPVSANGAQTTSLFPTLPFNGTIAMELDGVRTFSTAVIIRPFADFPEEDLLSRIQPFFGVGIGFTLVHVDSARVYDNLGNFVGISKESSVGAGISFPVYAGIDFRLTDSIAVTSEYIFSQALGLTFDNLDTAGETSSLYLDHTFMFGLKFFWDSGN